MLGEFTDSVLTRLAARGRSGLHGEVLPTRSADTPVGRVRVYDSGSGKPCVIVVPDGPNVIEHYEYLAGLLSQRLRVVCFDMPGFGFSFPRPSYGHSLDQGARAVLGVLDVLGIETATLAFSCANGFYALRAAQIAPKRISSLVLSQTPSLAAMRAWTDRVVPSPLRVPVIGQVAAWSLRKKSAHGWYKTALPGTTDAGPYQEKALHALSHGACFCLAGVVQGLAREHPASVIGVTTPCTMIWGPKDRSHRYTDPASLQECVPHAEILQFEDCGHFPDLEQPERFAEVLFERVAWPVQFASHHLPLAARET
jgi:pimeloyl-ACP methyl ester carboxylesterase